MKKILAVAGINAFFTTPKKYFQWMTTPNLNILPYLKRRKEAIKRFFKSYFCFWVSTGDILILHALAFMVLVIISILTSQIFDISLWMMIKISFFVTLGHLILSSILWVVYIETPSEYWERKAFCEILVVDGKANLLTSPIWASGTRYVIEKFEFSPKNSRSPKTATFRSIIPCFYGNAILSIPMTVTMNLTEQFDRFELFRVLFKSQNGSKSLSLGKYVNSLTDLNDQINTPVGEYIRQEISCPDFLDQAINFVTFPEKPFSNVTSVDISLGEPISSSRK